MQPSEDTVASYFVPSVFIYEQDLQIHCPLTSTSNNCRTCETTFWTNKMGQSDVKASSEQVSNKAVEKFINTHGQSDPSSRSTKRLKDPIVIPQRRPGQKSRGFIEAYAPDLEQFGITKEAFLDLISAVNDATKTSKWLFAIQVAAAGAGFVPNNIAMGTAAGVQLIAGIIAKAEQRWK